MERSYWDNTLEHAENGMLAIRLGFRQIKGFREEDAFWITATRGNGYPSIDAVWRRAGLAARALWKLAASDAFHSYGLTRREAIWSAKGLGGPKPLPLFEKCGEGIMEPRIELPLMSKAEEVFEDYVSTRRTLREHPLELLRSEVGRRSFNTDMRDTPDGEKVSVAGLVITRQRPGTASGVIFITLEDETGTANIVVWPNTFEQYRKIVMTGRLLKIRGKLQREGIVTHVIANEILDYSYLLDSLGDADGTGDQIEPTRDNADEVKRPVPVRDLSDKSNSGPNRRLARDKKQRGNISQFYNTSGARHPREQAKKLFPSRDFH